MFAVIQPSQTKKGKEKRLFITFAKRKKGKETRMSLIAWNRKKEGGRVPIRPWARGWFSPSQGKREEKRKKERREKKGATSC